MLRYSISDRLLVAADKVVFAPLHPNGDPGHSLHPADSWPAPVLSQAQRLAASGVDFFLVREPDLPARDLARLAREIIARLQRRNAPTRLLLHARPDIAVAVGAHGVHLPGSPGQLAPSHIRELYRLSGLPNPVVSLSCHTLDDIRGALTGKQRPEARPDLLLFGPVFEKRVRGELVQPGSGLDLLRQACQLAYPTPVLALGGVTDSNTDACLAAGAAGVAAIRLFL